MFDTSTLAHSCPRQRSVLRWCAALCCAMWVAVQHKLLCCAIRCAVQCAVQVMLAPSEGGLILCSASGSTRAPFPWTAAHAAFSGVTGSALAVATKPRRGEAACLHILDAAVQAFDSPQEAVSLTVKLESLVAMSPEAPAAGEGACRPLDVGWVSDAAAAVIVKRERPGGHATQHVCVCGAGGHAAEVALGDDEPCRLAAEIDGCVVLGEVTWTLVRDVPMAVQRALSPGQTEPAGMLVAASECFGDRDARCEGLLETIRGAPADARQVVGSLPEAIQDCVLTAGWLHSVPRQRELLAAALYGRAHAPHAADASLIPLCALHARVLNSLRKPSTAGRGTTRKQLEWLVLHNRLQYIADALCSAELFPLAFDLASDAQLPIATGPVLLRWAQAVIDTLGTDRQACLAWLRRQLDRAPGVSWAAVAEYARERNYITLVEDLLALDPRDRHVVPQLMQLHPFSALALSKALHTCASTLALLVLLDSFGDGTDAAQSRQFYEYVRDPEGAPPRGVLPGQAADLWQSFVLSLVMPLPNVSLGGLKERVFAQHYLHAPPMHRALLTLSEVVVSTAGPAKEGEEVGANKGRTRFPREWDDQQRLLQVEVETLQHPSAATKAAAADGVRRGVSALAGGSRTTPWWQAGALKQYTELRKVQQRLEGQAKLQLVGLSVIDTARKLKEKQQDALYHEFADAMLPDRGKSAAAVRCSRMRFAIECDVLAKSRKFKALLDKAEADKAKSPLGDEKIGILVTTALRHGIQHDQEFERPLSAHRGALGLRERLGTVMNGMADQDGRERLKEKLRSACGHRAGSSGPSLEHDASTSSPALSSVGDAILQQAGAVGALIGQRAGQVRDQILR
eukprot:jgi/Ulvmu1/1232/UM109_0030.1